jgi:DNA polymerase III delta prime subunit
MWRLAGHDWVVGVLNSSLAEEKVSHAYLFTGPPGIGKSTLALNLAQALLCEAKDKPCGDCEPCTIGMLTCTLCRTGWSPTFSQQTQCQAANRRPSLPCCHIPLLVS